MRKMEWGGEDRCPQVGLREMTEHFVFLVQGALIFHHTNIQAAQCRIQERSCSPADWGMT